MSTGQGQIGPVDLSTLNHLLQTAVGLLVLRNHHQSAGASIQPVDDAGPSGIIAPADVTGQEINQGRPLVGRTGMDHESGRFFDYRQVSILEDPFDRSEIPRPLFTHSESPISDAES